MSNKHTATFQGPTSSVRTRAAASAKTRAPAKARRGEKRSVEERLGIAFFHRTQARFGT